MSPVFLFDHSAGFLCVSITLLLAFNTAYAKELINKICIIKEKRCYSFVCLYKSIFHIA